MGWHYTLIFTCKILPQYHEFIQKKHLWHFTEPVYTDSEDETTDSDASSIDSFEEMRPSRLKSVYNQLSKDYRDLVDIWVNLDIAQFEDYSFEDGIFHCCMTKKVTNHPRDLEDDYKRFLRDILVPITSEITECKVISDDCLIFTHHYTDTELRGKGFNLVDMIRHVEHTYNEDGTEILESRVVYKRSIKALQFIDLDRAYKPS